MCANGPKQTICLLGQFLPVLDRKSGEITGEKAEKDATNRGDLVMEKKEQEEEQ